MHCYTRPTQIRNRCILGGKGRGILSDFKMSRVRRNSLLRQSAWTLVWWLILWQYNFRLQALAGNLPGVKKASW